MAIPKKSEYDDITSEWQRSGWVRATDPQSISPGTAREDAGDDIGGTERQDP